MKAFAGVLAVLVMLSCTSLAQTAPIPSTEPAAATAGAIAAVPFGPGAKLFLEPMNGFEQLLADAIVQKKVPVVLVKEREQADFVVSGTAKVRKRGFVTGFVMTDHGGANISVKAARSGNQVFACNFHRVDSMLREGDIYLGWAGQCAGHLKKALKQK